MDLQISAMYSLLGDHGDPKEGCHLHKASAPYWGEGVCPVEY